MAFSFTKLIDKGLIKEIFEEMLPSEVHVLFQGQPEPFVHAKAIVRLSIRTWRSVGQDDFKYELDDDNLFEIEQGGIRYFSLNVLIEADDTDPEIAIELAEIIKRKLQTSYFADRFKEGNLVADAASAVDIHTRTWDEREVAAVNLEVDMGVGFTFTDFPEGGDGTTGWIETVEDPEPDLDP